MPAAALAFPEAQQVAPALADPPAPKKRGPKTPEGKARSSMNALKHGLRARTFGILPEEDRAEWAEHLDDLRRCYGPVDAAEEKLVTAIAVAMWNEIRADRTLVETMAEIPPRRPGRSHGTDIQDPAHARSLGTAIRYLTAAGMATQRAQRAFLAHRKAKQAGLILPAAEPEAIPANQNCTNEFLAVARDPTPATAASAPVAEKCTNELRHPSRPRLAPEPLGHLRAAIADVPAPPAADPIREPPHLASRLQVTPGRIFPCPAASG